jgi:hypothetical protein
LPREKWQNFLPLSGRRGAWDVDPTEIEHCVGPAGDLAIAPEQLTALTPGLYCDKVEVAEIAACVVLDGRPSRDRSAHHPLLRRHEVGRLVEQGSFEAERGAQGPSMKLFTFTLGVTLIG